MDGDGLGLARWHFRRRADQPNLRRGRRFPRHRLADGLQPQPSPRHHVELLSADRPMPRSSLLIPAIGLLLASGQVWAADPQSADALIQQGLEMRRQAKPEEALALFQRAHAAAPSPRTFGQMGLVETSLKHWVDANLHLTVSLTSPDDAWVVKNRAFLEQALATTKQHIGDLVVSGPADVEVFVDGKSVGTLPAIPPVHLGEGQVHVSATAPGFKPFDETVSIRVGVRVQIAIALRPIALDQA